MINTQFNLRNVNNMEGELREVDMWARSDEVLPLENREEAQRRIYAYKEGTTLDLSNLFLANLPEDLFTLPRFSKITALKLDGNFLVQLPRSFQKLQEHLTCLSLAKNYLATVPKELGEHRWKVLAYVNLEGNNLVEIPQFLYMLPAIRELDLRNNDIHSLALRVSPSMKEIHFEGNNNIFLPIL